MAFGEVAQTLRLVITGSQISTAVHDTVAMLLKPDAVERVRSVAHGLVLNVAHSDGSSSIFVWRIFPDTILDVKPRSPSGSIVTVRQRGRDPVTTEVTQSVEEVKSLVEECRRLDALADDPGARSTM